MQSNYNSKLIDNIYVSIDFNNKHLSPKIRIFAVTN